MPRVLLQAGHVCPNGGGAPGEAAWTQQLADFLANLLRDQGIEVEVVGGWLSHVVTAWVEQAPPDVVLQDYDLFVALHYDAAIYGAGNNTGCFADRATADPQAAAADDFIALWEATYPIATGIALHNERRNANTSEYYAFRATSARTPGVLIEHGVGAPGAGEDAVVLHTHLEWVAWADARAICAFLGIGTAAEPEPKADTMSDDERAAMQTKLDTLVSTNSALSDQVAALHEEVTHLRVDVLPVLEQGAVDQLALTDLRNRLARIEQLATVLPSALPSALPAALPAP